MNPVLAAAYRSSLPIFLMKVFSSLEPNEEPLKLAWYLKAICHVLMSGYETSGARWVISVPPRHLKSITASVAFPAFILGLDPTRKIMVATYSMDLARLHASQCRMIMKSAWYRAVFPNTVISDEGDRMYEIVTTAGGGRKAVSVGGTVTGFGAHIIIVDDCLKPEDARSEVKRAEAKAWYDGTLSTRINQIGGGSVYSISQRLHEDDLAAHLLDKDYSHLCLPAIAEKVERIQIGAGQFHRRSVGSLLDRHGHVRALLDAERIKIGSQNFAAQYQQNPVAPEGNLIRLDWFGTYEEVLPRDQYQKVLQSWDTALTDNPSSDYSVCLTVGFRDDHWHVLHVLRKRLTYPDLKRAVLSQRRLWRADKVLIERAGSGISLAQEFRAEGQFRPVSWPVNEHKDVRLIGVSGQLEAGRVLLPADAPWLEALQAELRAFPFGRNDDQVDALTQFLAFDLQRRRWVESEYGADGRLLRVNRREQPRRVEVARARAKG